MDLIEQLGELAFASRLRRLSDRLMKDVSRIYREEKVSFEARWFPLLYLLREGTPMAVTEIARALGVTHPAVHQIAVAMIRRKLLLSRRDPGDERRRLLALSPKGMELARQLEPLWREIALATHELIAQAGGETFPFLEKMEQGLDERPMYQRIRARLDRRPLSDVEVVPFRQRYGKRFRELNREWIEKHFAMEPMDEAILADPRRRIIDRGGQIFFALQGKEVIGTCALLRHGADLFELSKMAVTEKAQGRQVGRRLAQTALEKAGALGARTVFLQTSPRLLAANNLYRSLGFTLDPGKDLPVTAYARPTITMRLDLARAPGSTAP